MTVDIPRNRSIDAFRGVSIIGMVFFTLTLKLGRDLPDVLLHNARGSVHLGDFVFPMFIFASGLSLAYFLEKRKNDNIKDFSNIVLRRFGMLALVAVFLSPFSARGLFLMDEVMLIAICFLACIVLIKFDWRILLGVIFMINMIYLLLINPGFLSSEGAGIFSDYYLGGYAAIPFFLPIMLVALMVGREIIAHGLNTKKNLMIISIISLYFIITWALVPIDKMAVSPSFMMLSILFCFFVFLLVKLIVHVMQGLSEIEYMGKRPLRYWIMMYVGVLIPLKLYMNYTGLTYTPKVDWPLSILISISVILLLWIISNLYDHFRGERSATLS